MRLEDRHPGTRAAIGFGSGFLRSRAWSGGGLASSSWGVPLGWILQLMNSALREKFYQLFVVWSKICVKSYRRSAECGIACNVQALRRARSAVESSAN